jgi:preprotein translocase subunit SecG
MNMNGCLCVYMYLWRPNDVLLMCKMVSDKLFSSRIKNAISRLDMVFSLLFLLFDLYISRVSEKKSNQSLKKCNQELRIFIERE